MLIVMEDRNVNKLAKSAFNDEALRCFDILKVDPAKGRAKIAHAVDEFVSVFCIDF